MYIMFVDNNIFKSATFDFHFLVDRKLLLRSEMLFVDVNKFDICCLFCHELHQLYQMSSRLPLIFSCFL